MHLIGQQSRVNIQKDKIMKIMLLSVAVGFTVAMVDVLLNRKLIIVHAMQWLLTITQFVQVIL